MEITHIQKDLLHLTQMRTIRLITVKQTWVRFYERKQVEKLLKESLRKYVMWILNFLIFTKG